MTARIPLARWMKRFALVTLLAAVVLPMAGCGKKGPLEPPPGSEKSDFPRPYPTY